MPKPHRVETDDGRYYEVTVDGEVHKLISVTTVLNAVMSKPALIPWAYNVGVEQTVRLLGGDAERANNESRSSEFALGLSLITPSEIKDRLKTRSQTYDDVRLSAANRGTTIHSFLEDRIETEINPDYQEGTLLGSYDGTEDLQGYIQSLDKFEHDYKPEWLMSEQVVYDLDFGFAGTLDAVCRIRSEPGNKRHPKMIGKTFILDLKTGKDGRVYPESHFPQLAAYEYAYRQEEEGMPPIDGGFILAAGPESYSVGVNYHTFDSFRAALVLYRTIEEMKARNPNARKKS